MRLTLRAGVDLGLLVLRLVERPDDVAALDTVVLDHAELGEDPAAAAHHSAMYGGSSSVVSSSSAASEAVVSSAMMQPHPPSSSIHGNNNIQVQKRHR